MRSCCVNGCKSDIQISFFTFPKEPERRNLWLKNIERNDLEVTRHTQICIKHFKEEFIIREHKFVSSDGKNELVLPRKRLTLTQDAYPLIELPESTLKVEPIEMISMDIVLKEEPDDENELKESEGNVGILDYMDIVKEEFPEQTFQMGGSLNENDEIQLVKEEDPLKETSDEIFINMENWTEGGFFETENIDKVELNLKITESSVKSKKSDLIKNLNDLKSSFNASSNWEMEESPTGICFFQLSNEIPFFIKFSCVIADNFRVKTFYKSDEINLNFFKRILGTKLLCDRFSKLENLLEALSEFTIMLDRKYLIKKGDKKVKRKRRRKRKRN